VYSPQRLLAQPTTYLRAMTKMSLLEITHDALLPIAIQLYEMHSAKF
jgi:hypothetical protein